MSEFFYDTCMYAYVYYILFTYNALVLDISAQAEHIEGRFFQPNMHLVQFQAANRLLSTLSLSVTYEYTHKRHTDRNYYYYSTPRQFYEQYANVLKFYGNWTKAQNKN